MTVLIVLSELTDNIVVVLQYFKNSKIFPIHLKNNTGTIYTLFSACGIAISPLVNYFEFLVGKYFK